MSNAFGLISQWLPALASLRSEMVRAEAELRAWAAQYPDLADVFIARADKLAEQIAQLDASISPEAVANLAVAVVSELRNLAVTRTLDPRPHPSDLA